MRTDTITAKKKAVFISWAPFCSRSDSIAIRIGAQSYMVYAARWGSRPSTVLLKYAVQTWKTFRILLRERPDVVFVMTPPVVACLPVWIYCRLFHGCFAIDAHSGALLDPRWTPLLFLHRFFSRRAAATFLTNTYLCDIVKSWGGKTMLIGDVPVVFAQPTPTALSDSFNITLVNTFNRDEPLDLFLSAAQTMPDVQFYVTGSTRDADQELLRRKPANVQFTGFLPDSQYVGLLLASDAVMCLTTLEHTMQRGAYEAVYLGKPIVVTGTKFLRTAFHKGTVHVENSVTGIARGVEQMKENVAAYQREIEELRLEKLDRWKRVESALREWLSTNENKQVFESVWQD